MRELLKHPITAENVTAGQLDVIIAEEWSNMVSMCPTLDPDAKINAYFDSDLVGSSTLAWAAHTIVLKDNVWQPSLTTLEYAGYDFTIGVNPAPFNGWHVSSVCSGISWRYDLRTVLRHEMIHGMGFGTSINGAGLTGHYSRSTCYPRIYDSVIEDEDGNRILDGCTLQRDISMINLYINGVQLFNPYFFMPGSSISHHTTYNALMFWQLHYGECLGIGTPEIKILSAVGTQCSGNPLYSAAPMAYPALYAVSLVLILFLF